MQNESCSIPPFDVADISFDEVTMSWMFILWTDFMRKSMHFDSRIRFIRFDASLSNHEANSTRYYSFVRRNYTAYGNYHNHTLAESITGNIDCRSNTIKRECSVYLAKTNLLAAALSHSLHRAISSRSSRLVVRTLSKYAQAQVTFLWPVETIYCCCCFIYARI